MRTKAASILHGCLGLTENCPPFQAVEQLNPMRSRVQISHTCKHRCTTFSRLLPSLQMWGIIIGCPETQMNSLFLKTYVIVLSSDCENYLQY